jgi:succinate dehydrogenase/fumarate reductase flavoprotein subunit
MERYAPEELERVSRGTMLACLYREVAAGRGPIAMDATGISAEDFRILEEVEKRRILAILKEVSVDYRRERFEVVSPVVHGFLGGVRTDGDGQTAIAGLYAVGETAGAVHGAERVGSFISACAVFGLRAGRHAAKTALKKGRPAVPEEQAALVAAALREAAAPREGIPPERVLKKVQEIAGKGLACIRTAAGLQEASQALETLRREALPALRIAERRDFIRALELRNLCLTGQLVAAAALARTETRGQHRRDDYPERDAAWLRHILLRREGEAIRVTTAPIVE